MKFDIVKVARKLSESGTGFGIIKLILEGDPICGQHGGRDIPTGDGKCCKETPATAEALIDRLERHGQIVTADKVREMFNMAPEHQRDVSDTRNAETLIQKHANAPEPEEVPAGAGSES